MFTDFSWSNYTVVVTILLVIYYLFIGFRFYIHELKSIFLKGKFQFSTVSNEVSRKTRNHNEPDQELSESGKNSFGEYPNEAFQEVEDLISRLKAVIEEGARNQLPKQGFSQNIKLVLKEYPSLKNSTFQAAVVELIISECEKYGFTMLDEDEIVVLWDSDQ